MSEHNRWTNYETWLVNLWCFDGMAAEDGLVDEYYLRSVVEHLIKSNSKAHSLVRDLATAFVAQVNFQEIADFINSQIAEEV
jgi:hypothetical protein